MIDMSCKRTSFDIDKLHLEYQVGVRRDVGGSTFSTIAGGQRSDSITRVAHCNPTYTIVIPKFMYSIFDFIN